MFKNRQRGAAGIVALIAIVAIVVVLGGIFFMSYVSAANYGNATEARLKAKLQDNENVLSSGYQQLKGVAGATSMARDDQIAIFKAAIQGRYGPNGSQQVFLMVKEANGGADPQLYRKVQQVVESTQKEFQNSQTQMLDILRTYQTALGSFWQGMWLKFAGYPKINFADYAIVSSDAAADAFKTKRQKAPDFGRDTAPAPAK